MIKFIESSNIFNIFNSDGTIKDSRVDYNDLVFIPEQSSTNTKFKGHEVSGKSILITRGNAYQLVGLDQLKELEDLIYAGL